MLEGVTVELCVVVEVVGVCKEIATRAEDIATAHIWTWQSYLLGTGNFKAVLGLAVQRFPYFIAQVGVGVLIANNLHGIIHACGAMVGS
jgi:hypothetical protein